jgi:gamma-glutamylcyclotransferase (GGCT)/AIG2-like uncharacterized protein YtfP
MIPAEAAGRQALFFYGTLADPDVLARVLGRAPSADKIVPGLLEGFCRLEARSASYPLLVPSSGATVSGLLLRFPSRRDIARLNHFESGEYQAERRTVRLDEGSDCEAWLYVGLPHLVLGEESWDLATWQQQHKAAFLAQCDAWMADCPEPD